MFCVINGLAKGYDSWFGRLVLLLDKFELLPQSRGVDRQEEE
jgi:hypothetical protein